MHKAKWENPDDWSTVKFMENEGERYLDEMNKDLEDVESYL
jgi:hypothetical protein